MIRHALFGCSVLLALLAAAPTGLWAQGHSDLAQSALEDTTFTWKSLGSETVQVYYQSGSFAERHRVMLLRSASGAVAEALDCLGKAGYDRPIRVFYLNSREEMKRIVGQPYSGFANWTAASVFVVFAAEWRSFEKHEIAHVLMRELWGDPDSGSGWMVEGTAVYCDGWCREYSVDEIASHFLSLGELPPLRDLFDDFASLGEIRGGFYAASVIGFIRHTYGAEALRGFWLGGHGNLQELLGADIDQVEALWRDYLKSTVRKDAHVDLEEIKKGGCG